MVGGGVALAVAVNVAAEPVEQCGEVALGELAAEIAQVARGGGEQLSGEDNCLACSQSSWSKRDNAQAGYSRELVDVICQQRQVVIARCGGDDQVVCTD